MASALTMLRFIDKALFGDRSLVPITSGRLRTHSAITNNDFDFNNQLYY